jgi:phosphoadenosine phosphosulfate reductase
MNLQSPEFIAQANADLRNQSALDIVKWGLSQAGGRAIVSTNFRPYEAVILHLVTQVQPDIPVLWVDHGYNRPATYKHAEDLKARLKLNIKPYLPKIIAALEIRPEGQQRELLKILYLMDIKEDHEGKLLV